MAGQKRPADYNDIYAEEEFEEEYDEAAYDDGEQEYADRDEGEDFPDEDAEQEDAAPPPPPPQKPAAHSKRSRPASTQPKQVAAPARLPSGASRAKRPATSQSVPAQPARAASSASNPVRAPRKPAAQKPKPLAVVKSEPIAPTVAAQAVPVAPANAPNASNAIVKSETLPLQVCDVYTTITHYLHKLDKTMSLAKLKETFENAYLSNYDLPGCLFEDFDVEELSNHMDRAMRGDRKANKLALRLWQAYSLSKWLAEKGVKIRGFTSENTKKQGNNFVIAESLAGGEKRADQPHEAADVVAKVVYIGDPFQYPQKDSPSKVPVSEQDQKRLGSFSCKSHVVFYPREQVARIVEELDKQERQRYFENRKALQKLKVTGTSPSTTA